ncbi:glycoside hydrolase family 3 N-terminal domain-containing protein [Paenibacillus qinlingensis]|uniref:beta-N-acetylhexosaminidase n=1 Tax=Paenibacillus qinlingensis TaxID=1837343 RepID=A0ABU1P551_9BACL|nr:glycoside hydrolase family 3 N-terminal domain-containing protein [Paenibacillus qinlingensis]MDR6554866.1 beta-glucosidase-like glycosyl hydrolase [Paenibacillus qinlingensis]
MTNHHFEPIIMSISNLSLEEKVAEMCVLGLAKQTPPSEDKSRLGQIGGVGIFPHDIGSYAYTKKLLQEVREAAGQNRGGVPFYMSIDEEAGSLSNFKEFFPYIPGNRAVALREDPQAAYALGRLVGSQLHELGIPMNWAPVLDVNTNIDNPVIGVRAFGEDPQLVAAFGEAYIQGLHSAGIASTAKHFPGHGQVSGDSHYVLPECELTVEDLLTGPLIPFQRAIEAQVDSIMLAHLIFPNIPESEGLPASLSKYFVTNLLREQLGYEGVICTDDVEMGAIKNNFEPEEVGRLAIQAGNDMILMCHTPDFQQRVMNGIVQAVRAGEIAESQIDASLVRIERLKNNFGLYREKAQPLPMETWEAEALAIAKATIVVERDPAALLPLSPSTKYVLLVPRQEQLTIADNAAVSELILGAKLQERNIHVKTVYTSMQPSEDEIEAMMAEITRYDVVMLGTINAHIYEGQLQLARRIAKTKPLLAIVLRNPYDAALLPQEASKVLMCSTSDYAMRAFAELHCWSPN